MITTKEIKESYYLYLLKDFNKFYLFKNKRSLINFLNNNIVDNDYSYIYMKRNITITKEWLENYNSLESLDIID